MLTAVVLVELALRWFAYDADTHTGAVVVVLSLVVAALTPLGGTIGGSLAYDYGFKVETSGDHPVWHKSERDVFPSPYRG